MLKRVLIAVGLLWAAPAWATIGTINIANAPEWQSSHSYAIKDRIVAGPGWNGSAYTNGQNLCLFAVTVGGTTSTDPTVYNTACSAGTPAAVGGGLDGTIPAGWSGKTTVTDGGATFVLLSKVDYVTITGFNCDDSRNWAQSTSYSSIDHVVNGAHCYVMDTTFGGSNPCTSLGSGSGPTGTTFGSAITDNTCRWYYQGDLTYTSTTHRLPHEIFVSAASYQIQYSESVTVQLWYGGAQRTHYGPQQTHELNPLQVNHHTGFAGDINLYCQGSITVLYQNCVSSGVPYFTTYTPASGDGIRDNLTAAVGPLRYDESKGVAIFSNEAQSGSNSVTGIAWSFAESISILDGLQIEAVHGSALPTTPGTTTVVNNGGWIFGPSNGNFLWIRRSIIEGAGTAALECDYNCYIDNSVVISTEATISGAAVAHFKFNPIITNSTFVCGGAPANSSGVQVVSTSNTTPVPPYNNNLILGCAYPYGHVNSFATAGADNATDVAGSPSTTFTDATFGIGTMNAAQFPGASLTGITAANQLVNPTVGASFDARVKNTSADIYGAAASFSYSQSGDGTLAWASPASPGSDFFGTTRPQSSRYDIGAVEFISGAPTVTRPLSGFIQ